MKDHSLCLSLLLVLSLDMKTHIPTWVVWITIPVQEGTVAGGLLGGALVEFFQERELDLGNPHGHRWWCHGRVSSRWWLITEL